MIRILIILGILIIAGIVVRDHFFMPKRILYPSLVAPFDIKTVLAIDLNADNDVHALTVLHGDDGILILHTGNQPGPHEHDIILGQAILANFDDDKNGRIDAHDKIYSRLELKFFDVANGTTRYVPIAQAGIRAIYIEPKYLNVKAPVPTDMLPHVVGIVIMADGSKRMIRDIPVNAQSIIVNPAVE